MKIITLLCYFFLTINNHKDLISLYQFSQFIVRFYEPLVTNVDSAKG